MHYESHNFIDNFLTIKNKINLIFDRIDAEFSFDYLNAQQIKNMFCKFFPCMEADEIRKLTEHLDKNRSQTVSEDGITASEVTRHLIKFSNSSSSAVANLGLIRDCLV